MEGKMGEYEKPGVWNTIWNFLLLTLLYAITMSYISFQWVKKKIF